MPRKDEEPSQRLRSVKVMAEWSADPVWFFDAHTRPVTTPVDPASPELGLSANLARDLTVWQADWDATLKHSDPASSAFPSKEAERRFDERGWELARRVRREVPAEWDVSYFSHLSNREVFLD